MRRIFVVLTLLGLTASATVAEEKLAWGPWSADLFARAKAENRFVILDLEAVWCHWCHVMEETTYEDPKVVALLKSKYLPVRVDQDANPDLSSRYGDWGWPATTIFAPDGTEIVKRRGYIEPGNMVSLLEAVIADPTPGPSVSAGLDVAPAETPFLSEVQRNDLIKRLDEAYDAENGGWGTVHKFIDAEAMDWMLLAAEKGDKDATRKARQTLDAALNLIDREWGGIFQYSDAVDWKSPHYEKIMSYQASGLRQYAAAYALWKEPKYHDAADDLYRYLTTKLLGPDGTFLTSQDADVDAEMPGKTFYTLSAAERSKLGREPRIDTNSYARENGWAVSGLVAYANATGDKQALEAAEKAARWVVENRALASGGFAHGAKDRGGPYIGDTLAMGQAGLDLYAATGDRAWLKVAREAGEFIAAKFKDEAGGFLTTLTSEGTTGAFLKPVKPLDEQVAVTRFLNKLNRYFGTQDTRALAEHGMRYLASPAILEQPMWLAGVLVADREVTAEPTHITIVGRKGDTSAQSLHSAGRAYPALYKRLDWWDTREGPLPNPDVQYPEIEQAAAFACTNRICSLPAFSGDELFATVARMLAVKTSDAVR
jgi:uncharacterized protein